MLTLIAVRLLAYQQKYYVNFLLHFAVNGTLKRFVFILDYKAIVLADFLFIRR